MPVHVNVWCLRALKSTKTKRSKSHIHSFHSDDLSILFLYPRPHYPTSNAHSFRLSHFLIIVSSCVLSLHLLFIPLQARMHFPSPHLRATDYTPFSKCLAWSLLLKNKCGKFQFTSSAKRSVLLNFARHSLASWNAWSKNMRACGSIEKKSEATRAQRHAVSQSWKLERIRQSPREPEETELGEWGMSGEHSGDYLCVIRISVESLECVHDRLHESVRIQKVYTVN